MCENITGSYGCKTISEIITAICPDIFMIMSHFPVNQIKSNQIKSNQNQFYPKITITSPQRGLKSVQ